MIYALSFKHKLPEDALAFDVTSRSRTWTSAFSPFYLGPVELYDGHISLNLENAFQFSKIYAEYNGYDDCPSINYLEWAKKGWGTKAPIKYPLGAWNKHLYHWWDGKKISNLEAQNNIFLRLYKDAVVKTDAFKKLKELYETTDKDIYLLDFEGYDHRYLERNWDEVISNPDQPVGQAFALCMLLEGYL